MSGRFYRGWRCHWLFPDGHYCNRLFMDWRDGRKHLRRHAGRRQKWA